MSGDTQPTTTNNNNIVDLLSTLNPAAAATAAAAAISTTTTTTFTSSTNTTRNDDFNVDSSDFVPANRLLTQRQAINNAKQRIFYNFTCFIPFFLYPFIIF